MTGSTFKIEQWTVTIDGLKSVIRGKVQADPEKREILRSQARAMLEARDELETRARKLRPINPALNRTTKLQPRDASLDGWGRRQGSQALWSAGNCLRCVIGTLLQRDIAAIPDPRPLFSSKGGDWFDAYNRELASTVGVRLEEIPPGSCPTIGRVRWIAVLEEGDVNHAVIVNRDGKIQHDPNQGELNGLEVPPHRLQFGLRLVSANAPKTDRWGRKVA